MSNREKTLEALKLAGQFVLSIAALIAIVLSMIYVLVWLANISFWLGALGLLVFFFLAAFVWARWLL